MLPIVCVFFLLALLGANAAPPVDTYCKPRIGMSRASCLMKKPYCASIGTPIDWYAKGCPNANDGGCQYVPPSGYYCNFVCKKVCKKHAPYCAWNGAFCVSTATNAPVTAATNAPVPAATNAPVPAATNAPVPDGVTNAPVPDVTNAPVPDVTNAPVPDVTNAPVGGGNLPYTIEIVYLGTPPSAAIQDVMTQAKTKWESVFISGFPSAVTFPVGAWCGGLVNFDAPRPVDGLLIYASMEYIDGVGQILGSAGPCASVVPAQTRLGIMKFDSADLDDMLAGGTLYNVILHEMGHVLGVGTYWMAGQGVADPAYQSVDLNPNTGGYDYMKPFGNAADLTVGRDGQAVVEDQGGSGTARGHWKETTYDSELMTGYVEAAGVPMPMSALTLAALKDFALDVDMTKAEAYTAPAPGRRRLGQKVPFGCQDLGFPVVQLGPETMSPKKGREAEFAVELLAVKKFYQNKQ